MPRLFVAWFSLACSCTTVRSSALATEPASKPSTFPVTLSATRDPAGAQELGIVEAGGPRPTGSLDEIVDAFRKRVVELGGNYGRVDNFATCYEMTMQTYAYDCGTTVTEMHTQIVSHPGPNGTMTTSTQSVPTTRHVPRTCYGTHEVEVQTLTLTGRAFRAKGIQ